MHYKAFNLHIITPFECPELLEIDESENEFPRVVIEYGETPLHLENIVNSGPTFEANNDELLLNLITVGSYYIQNGDRIIIKKKDDSISDDIVRLFLFGSAIAALLYQRGFLLLHASAVKTGNGAALFCGSSGAGKSTTLQSFLKRGYQKLSDDTIALYYDENTKKVMCIPSYPQSKLWQESLEFLEYENDGLRQIKPDIEKYALSTKEKFHTQDTPLVAIFVLATHQKEEIEFTEVNGLEKFQVIKNQTYRKAFLDKLEAKKNQLKIGTLAAQQASIKRVLRPSGINTLDSLADKIEKLF